MAFSATKKSEQLLGGLRVQVWDLDFASVTEGTWDTGLGDVHIALTNDEDDDQAYTTKKNKSATATAAAGHVWVNAVTSSDTATCLVIGV